MMEKTKIKLEVGKSYQNRAGKTVKITSGRYTDERPYSGDDNYSYYEDGSFKYNKEKCDQDLIEEVADITDTTTTTTDPKGVYEVKYIATKNSEVHKLEDSLRKYICGLVTMGKYQDAKELLNILIEERK